MPSSRASSPSALLLVLAAASGCAPQTAPADVDSLSRYLFRTWNSSDPSVQVGGLSELETLLSSVDLLHGTGDRSWSLTPLTLDDLADVDWNKGRNPADCAASAIARESPWPIDDHAKSQLIADQHPFEPSSSMYTRTLLDGGACFLSRGCEVLTTTNEVTRSNTLYTVTYTLPKKYRWVTMPTGRHALFARAVTNQAFKASSGDATMQQSYAVDVWLDEPSPSGGQKVWRFQAVYAETQLALPVDNGIQEQVTVGAVDEAFKAADTQIGKLYHGQ